MAKPVLNDAGEWLYDRLAPWAVYDSDQTGWPLAVFCRAWGVMADQVYTASETGLDGLDDPNTAPAWYLPHLAMKAGVQIAAGWSETEIREAILTRPAERRGTPAAIIAAAQATLTGDKHVRLLEKADDDAYALTVVTRTSETPVTLLTNGSAETADTTGWTPRGQNNDPGSFLAAAASAQTGGFAFQVTRDTDGGGADTIYISQAVSVKAGAAYSAAARVMAASTGRVCFVSLVWRDTDGALISVAYSATATDSTRDWTLRSIDAAVAPVGAVSVDVRVNVDGVPEGETHYIDSIAFVQGAMPDYYPDATPARTLAALIAAKPVRLKLTHVVVDGWTIGEMEDDYSGQTLADLEGDFATIGDLEDNNS